MNLRTRFLIALGPLLVFGIALIVFRADDSKDAPAYSATIRRDCAPWDGAAFTISIQMGHQVTLQISIYQSPDIEHPISFRFPDQTGQTGNAFLVLPMDTTRELTGKTSFQSVMQDNSAQGEFDFHAETGRQFKGKFREQWTDQRMLCR